MNTDSNEFTQKLTRKLVKYKISPEQVMATSHGIKYLYWAPPIDINGTIINVYERRTPDGWFVDFTLALDETKELLNIRVFNPSFSKRVGNLKSFLGAKVERFNAIVGVEVGKPKRFVVLSGYMQTRLLKGIRANIISNPEVSFDPNVRMSRKSLSEKDMEKYDSYTAITDFNKNVSHTIN